MKYLPHSRGFTLVELIVVMTILGILSSVGFSKFSSTNTFRERGFSDETLSSFRYAHRMATSTGCHFRIQVDSSSFRVSRWPTCRPADHNVVTSAAKHPNNSGDFTNLIPNGITVTTMDIYFDGSGNPHNTSAETAIGSATTLTIGSNSLQIEAETGFAHLL